MAKNLLLSNSSFKTLQRCEYKYVLKYVDGLVPKRKQRPLYLGTWIHLLLQEKYRPNGMWKAVQQKLVREYAHLLPEEKEHLGNLPEITTTIMEGYERTWATDHADWKILETEKSVELPISQDFTYVARLDVIAEDDDGVWIWDHKTHKGKQPSEDYRTSDPQSSLYNWVYEKLTGIKPAGFVFNYLRTKPPAVPRLLKNGKGISRAANIDTNWYTLMKTLRQYNLDPNDYREELAAARARNKSFYDRVFIPRPAGVINNLLRDIRQKLPRIKELHEGARPTRNLTYECDRSCEYRILCLTELTGGDGTYIRRNDYMYKPWEEYGDAEEEEGSE